MTESTADENKFVKKPSITADPPNNVKPRGSTGDAPNNMMPQGTTADPYVYVDGKKEMADGSGMVKESLEEEDV